MEWNAIYRDLKTFNWVVLLILSSASALLLQASCTLGIIFGGLVIIANFNVLQHTIRGAFSEEGQMVKRRASIIAKYYFRLLALGLIIFFLISKEWIHPVGLAIGLSTVVISIFSYGIKRALKTTTSEAA
jgi:hypothetical protein